MDFDNNAGVVNPNILISLAEISFTFSWVEAGIQYFGGKILISAVTTKAIIHSFKYCYLSIYLATKLLLFCYYLVVILMFLSVFGWS